MPWQKSDKRHSQDSRRWEMKRSSKMSLKYPFPLGESVSGKGNLGRRLSLGKCLLDRHRTQGDVSYTRPACRK